MRLLNSIYRFYKKIKTYMYYLFHCKKNSRDDDIGIGIIELENVSDD